MIATTSAYADATTSATSMPFAPGAASSPLSEEQFAACLAGDSQAWERLLKLSSPIITAIARTDFGLHREDVEDVVQMVHLKLYEHLSALRDPASFGCWLRRMTRHIIIDMLRQKRQTVSLEALVEDTGLEPTLPAGSQPEDSDGVIATRLDLRRALASLPPLYREPVVYYLLQGKAQDEIGNLLGRPRSTVATQIQRGLARLRRSLGAGYEDECMTA